MIIKVGFKLPQNSNGELFDINHYTSDTKKKAQANARAIATLQCSLTHDQLSEVGPFSSDKESWEKHIELHEGLPTYRPLKRTYY